jgi:multidrug efflux pump subunit AcrA (membrane-fusion protein)
MNPPNSLWRPAALVLPVVSAWFLTGCNSQPPAGATGFPPPPTVTVAAVETREIIEHEEVVGRTEAVDSVEIRPRVSGYIQEVRFKSGLIPAPGRRPWTAPKRTCDAPKVPSKTPRPKPPVRNAC